MRNLIITAIFLAGSAIADDLTVPNTFQAGTPARAAEVNDNFTAVEASVDDNAADITTNSTDIANNAGDIAGIGAAMQGNGVAIATNSADIQTNATAISGLVAKSGMQVYSNGNSIGHLVTFFGPSSAFIQSDMGYMFETAIIGPPYLSEFTLYYSGTGCGGTIYVPLAGFEWAGRTTGIVVRAFRSGGPVAADVHYVARGSTGVPFVSASSFESGACQDGANAMFGFEAFPNDEAITGVPSLRPSLEFYIGVP